MQERASTNQSVMRKIKEAPIGASPLLVFFCSYTLNNGMKISLEKVNAVFATKFRKLFQLIIQHKVKSR